MTSEVTTGSADDNIADLAGTMTEMRVRHVPIVDADGKLTAIVSIGDIVKHRLSELQSERDQLRDYITQLTPDTHDSATEHSAARAGGTRQPSHTVGA